MRFQIKDHIPDYTDDQAIKSEFKKRINAFFNCRYSIPVVNGTVAIEVALKALDIPRGSLVILPDISFIATAVAIADCGLIPVYADISEEYFGITLAEIERKYNKDVAAVIVVHLAGLVNREIFEIQAFCQSHGIYLIEDCAQAFVCQADGQNVGTIGDIGTLSFQSSKIVNCGEGGLVITNRPNLAARCEAVVNWGSTFDYSQQDLEMPSGNFRMSAVHDFLIIKQMEIIDEIINERLQRTEELVRACEERGIETCYPAKNDRYFDCPFFLPVKSRTKINTIEPRAEYPMHRSSIVKAVFRKYYPDLLEKYLEYNHFGKGSRSHKVLQDIDFINISQNNSYLCSEILAPYEANKAEVITK